MEFFIQWKKEQSKVESAIYIFMLHKFISTPNPDRIYKFVSKVRTNSFNISSVRKSDITATSNIGALFSKTLNANGHI